MAYEFPHYIRRAHILGPEIRYPWDDWDVHKAYKPAKAELLERLPPLSPRALIALTIASSEWLVFRLNSLEDDPNPPDFLEAAWAASIDPSYMLYEETDSTQWRGPIRGPLNVAMMMILDALFVERQAGGPAPHPAWMSNLVELVLPESSEFRRWRDGCIIRLSRCSPARVAAAPELLSEDPGDCVPRELFDLDVDFDPRNSKQLIDRFLHGLEGSDNPFLYSAEEMTEKGFDGIPYRFHSPAS